MELAVFTIVAFVLGGVLIMNRERIPERLLRPLAVTAVFLIAAAFVMVIARFLTAG